MLCAQINECFVHRISGISFTFRAQRYAPTYTELVATNLNGFSIGFFCSHSAHNMKLRRIHRLPISVGLAPINFFIWLLRETYHVTLLEFKFITEERGAYFFMINHIDQKLCLMSHSDSSKANIQVGIRCCRSELHYTIFAFIPPGKERTMN